jgi:hypothetical protein
LLILLLEVFTFLIPTIKNINNAGGMAAVLPAILSDLTNKEREENKLQTLTVNPVLNKAAEMKALDMATNGYFAHTSPEGKTPWYWLEKVGYKYKYAGENLAINFNDSKDVTNAWMESPKHKSNIIKENYTEIGTGIATGTYQGRQTVFVAQVYANPLPKTAKILKPTKEVNTASNVINNKTPKSNVLGAEIVAEEEIPDTSLTTSYVEKPTILNKLFASPRNTTSIILYIIFGIITITLFLYLFMRIDKHHGQLITNGLMVLVIIGAILISNYYFSNQCMVITQDINYSNEVK